MDRSVLSALRAITPELPEIIRRRYAVLQSVAAAQPVGRRSLADRLGWPERMARTEVDLLRDLGCLDTSPTGVVVSAAGMQLLDDLKSVVWELYGLTELEAQLTAKFELRRACVVPGDSDRDPVAREAVARAAAEALTGMLRGGDVLAVSGGSTMAEVARHLPAHAGQRDVTVVPTGGGLGDTLEIEANAVATRFAGALGAQCRLLHLRDDLDKDSVELLLRSSPVIIERFELIRSARVVMQGIGSFDSVVRRRNFSGDMTADLLRRGAVGETLGYFFDINGNVVHSSSSVGLRLDDLGNVAELIAVAGGGSKADALVGVLSARLQHVLITDEAAARAMLNRLTETA